MICFERVRALREEHEMTQKMVAEILVVDKSTYAAWERGRDLFPLKRLLALSNFYQTSLDYMTGLSNQFSKPDLKEDINLNLLKTRIKEVRRNYGFTQERLAEQLNTTHSAISAYENGHLIMPLIFLYQIAKMCEVSIDYILGRTDEQKITKKELVSN